MLAVTGSNGFIGQALVARLRAAGRHVLEVCRQIEDGRGVAVGEIGPATDWSLALHGVETVVHLAGRAHVRGESESAAEAAFMAVNAAGTANLARQAALAGVRRLVYVSSVGVLGNSSGARPFTADAPPNPVGPYARSKWLGEQAVWQVAAEFTGFEVVVVRPPLVYGPGAPGNFARLVSLVRRGIPLPLAAVRNSRSLVALPNLVDLLVRCLDAPEAAGQTLLVSDDDDLSTPQLIREIAQAMGRKPRLFPFPPPLLRLAGRLLGRSTEVESLCGSLQVDISHTRQILGWSPPFSRRGPAGVKS
ncbi:NAD-dependent epimerase/dehydratase family protein [Desulfurivibrio alkaliphilus]|uniref:NAD-dependent epimerase/dehydratase n=1 Tax=Desulfurivibrio alkaliphilus (strain DSM 19089 / UNIQEM U267 / AHT2) TaxID=589865 RepID=D6Z4L8_DESAT|nr:NAD-dependent epimerase/dehydratase family protein [Desulfurivibrio alkaliphilus]ADH86493.1 NAD-dependent epimerase/dehydratase [Desulfurivibrio alkaliphilus AHT 2]